MTSSNFNSDFHLCPVSKLNVPGWTFREATWPTVVDAEVHKLFDGKIDGPVNYLRKRFRDDVIQNCRIILQQNNDQDYVIMKPDDSGYDYEVKRMSFSNRLPDFDSIDDSVVPHEIKCLICLDNKRTHVVPDCFHVVACATCAKKLYDINKKCPLCNANFTQPLKKIFF